ncbi:MAG: hypothetical protein CL879_00110 [Dehalococcoidia bacterium]|nr:hypothetical protein [Dehalococcoidia bacterium]
MSQNDKDNDNRTRQRKNRNRRGGRRRGKRQKPPQPKPAESGHADQAESRKSERKKSQKPNGGGSQRSGSRKSGKGGRGKRNPRDKRAKLSRPARKVDDLSANERARTRYEVSPRLMGLPKTIDPPPRKISITWKNSPVEQKVERKVSELVVFPGEFGWLSDEQVDELAQRIEQHDIGLDQCLSLRSALMQERAVYSHREMMGRSNMLRLRYENGEGVLSLSRRFQYPPVGLFRAILTSRGWSKVRIRDSLRDPVKRLSQRDCAEFKEAEEHDRVTNVDQAETHVRADTFEDILCDYFESEGVRFRRQEELLEEQKKEHGRPINTPDLLMIDLVEINGVPISWIDAKHFYGANLSFPKKKTKKQVGRYVDEWGTGAVVYRHGFCAGLKVGGALLLDSSPLDLSRLIQD